MKAYVYRELGQETLDLVDMERPDPGAGEVLIRVYCVGVNPVDWKAKDGLFEGMIPYHFPAVPGWDAAGVIEAAGEGVADFRPGDEVFVYGRLPTVGINGTYAEYTCLPADLVARKPTALSWAEAAGVPLVALTAWQALVDLAEVRDGQTVIVPAAAGGVGSFAVQIARHLGARVIASCSKENMDYVRSLGADEVIDYREGLESLPQGEADCLLGTLTPDRLVDYLGAMKPGAIVVTLAGDEGLVAAGPSGLRVERLYVESNGQQLATIAGLISEGRIVPLPVTVMPFEKANEALAISRKGHGRGKLILEVVPGTADKTHA
ncbi:MAG: NADP-dependent oxidoreductase [Alphaproteobacteria bacterium]|nr:MAG: NADP-dependent oxidoreductase [Alphaproteobacteria bacterium]